MKFTPSQMLNELAICYNEQGHNIWREIFPHKIHIEFQEWILMQEIVKEEFNLKELF